MTFDERIAYHLQELEIASNPRSPNYAMPEILATDETILDIGCGIGQTLAASRVEHCRLLVGVDVDLQSLMYGRRQFRHITFVRGAAAGLPFQDGCFDLVISRVTLPYTNIPLALAEIERVLTRDGRVWFTLHPLSMVLRHLERSVVAFELKDVVYRVYVVLNGIAFSLLGRQFPFFVGKRHESFQSIAGMTKAMRKAGFVDPWVGMRGGQFVCTAHKGG